MNRLLFRCHSHHRLSIKSLPIRSLIPSILMSSESYVTTSDSLSKPSTRKIRIYTRTGDKGTSALYNGERRPKDDAVFMALGSTDELSSTLGLAREYCDEMVLNNSAGLDETKRKGIIERLVKIQCLLQDIGSHIATPRNATKQETRINKTEFDPEGSLTKELESWIDEYDEFLPPLRNFILPSGGKTGSCLHLARTTCRRAERSMTSLFISGEIDEAALKYVNRLSDFLFTAARVCGRMEGKTESVYTKQGI